MKNSKKLEDVLPIYKCENDCLLSRQGDITVAYEVTLPEIFTLSNNDFEALHQTWIKAIRLLPNHSILHKQDWFVQSKYKGDFSNPEVSFLTNSSELFFNERPYLDHKCYLFITKINNTNKPASSLNSSLIRRSIIPAGSSDTREISTFFEKVGQFAKILQDGSYMETRRLTASELTGSDTTIGLLEKYCFLLNEQEPPVLRDFELDKEFKIGDQYVQIFSLADIEDLPSLCGPRVNYDKYSTDRTKFSISFAAPLGQLLNCDHIYNQYIVVDDAQETMKKMESKRLRLQSLSAYSRENSLSREAVNNFLNEAISQQRLPVKAHFNLIAWTNNKDQVKDVRNNISAALAQMDARTKQETVIAPILFFAGVPGGAAYLPRHEAFDTFCEQACTFFNMETNYQSSVSPVGMRLGDRITGRPLHVDISDEPYRKQLIAARNKFVLSGSGGGKSFFCNHYLRSYYETGAHIVVVDVGHSYKGLCTLLNGYYFTYSEADPIKFNPFYFDDDFDTEKKESIKTLLLSLWKKEDQSYSRSEYITLSNALQQYYDNLKDNPEIFPCFNSFYDFLNESFIVNLRGQGIKEKDFDIDNFLYVLRPYYKGGEYDYLLNATENLDLLNERLIIFELDAIKSHAILFSAVTIILMQTFITKMRKLKGVRKIILIEEAWKAIAKEGMAEYIKYLFKTVRKFYGEAVVVTQELQDLVSSNIIKDAIINNSDTKILLDQSKYANKFDFIQELLGLSDKEKTLILSLNKANDPTKKYKEVFISLGGVVSKVYRTEVSLEEYLAYTTEEKEKVKVQEYTQKYGSIKRGIAMLAKEIRDAS